jgi:hypothetical protein
MPKIEMPVNDILVIAKSRQIQRGMELVRGEDYAEAGDARLEFRSRLSAASCFWRAGKVAAARKHFASLRKDYPDRLRAIESAVSDLQQNSSPENEKKTRN